MRACDHHRLLVADVHHLRGIEERTYQAMAVEAVDRAAEGEGVRQVRHAHWFLVLYGRYGFGDHVSDPEAFRRRARSLLTATLVRYEAHRAST